MQGITLETITAMHDRVLAADGGDRRIVSEGNLHQIVFQANLAVHQVPRAARVFWSLCAYPPFREGNRRTAHRLAEGILSHEGSPVVLPCEEIHALIRGIDAFTIEIDDVERAFGHYAGKTT
jgi:prophage maintenance system killer protein